MIHKYGPYSMLGTVGTTLSNPFNKAEHTFCTNTVVNAHPIHVMHDKEIAPYIKNDTALKNSEELMYIVPNTKLYMNWSL
jgi:hypothetical protein